MEVPILTLCSYSAVQQAPHVMSILRIGPQAGAPPEAVVESEDADEAVNGWEIEWVGGGGSQMIEDDDQEADSGDKKVRDGFCAYEACRPCQSSTLRGHAFCA
jgi:hypothetical protein